MKISAMALGLYRTNTYILRAEGESRCLVIDPGYEPDEILDHVNQNGLTLEAILLTHGHFDHVGAVRQLVADTGCRVFLNPADCSMPPMMTSGALYYTDTYTGGETLKLAGLTFGVMSTPGHTPGSVCLIFDNHIFCGDTLFAGSCGRTDLPGGHGPTLRKSLDRLKALEGNFFLHPGHGPSSDLSRERRANPYLMGGMV